MTDEPLPPPVSDLIERIRARVAASAKVADIRELARQAVAEARGNSLTIAEITRLADVAVGQARKIEELMSRLADLAAEVTGP